MTLDLERQHQRYTDTTAAHLAGDPDAVPGDCWRTALACLLGVPRDEVPHFVHLHPEEGPAWWHASVAWVEEQCPGWTLVNIAPAFPVYLEPEAAPRRALLTGQSPRGDWHHVVVVDAITGGLVHDPFPGGGGVLTQTDVAALEYRAAAE